ncbi:MAG: hypothetical protein K2N71_07905, partial [Oscillospiraceae bacterium]|nr:hypothetical protein [Oscillospiraceae bacterium]
DKNLLVKLSLGDLLFLYYLRNKLSCFDRIHSVFLPAQSIANFSRTVNLRSAELPKNNVYGT